MQRNKLQISRVCRSTSKHSCCWRVFARVCLVLCNYKIYNSTVQTRQKTVDSGEKAPRSSSVKCQISEVEGDGCARLEAAARIKPRDPKFHLSKRRNCLNIVTTLHATDPRDHAHDSAHTLIPPYASRLIIHNHRTQELWQNGIQGFVEEG